MATENFNRLKYPDKVIIAMKGLPCTGKTLVAGQICDWAELPMLCIDDFIEAPHNNNNNNNNDIADDESLEEAERLQLRVLEQAFTTLCRVARRQLKTEFRCAVIKSRLSSPFELEQLISKLLVSRKGNNRILLIVECQVRNKHQWQNSFNDDDYEKTWYRPRRWNDIIDPQSVAPHDWDLHLKDLIQHHRGGSAPLVRRLVVDPYYDLDLPTSLWSSINPIFAHAINHLLRASHAKLNYQNPYVVEFDEFRRSRAKEVLNALTPSSTRSKRLCGADGCLFKYSEDLRAAYGYRCCCGVCEQKLVSGEAAGYTCHYCILTLHKSCAELIHLFDPRSIPIIEYGVLSYYIRLDLGASKEKHACNSHLQGFSGIVTPVAFKRL